MVSGNTGLMDGIPLGFFVPWRLGGSTPFSLSEHLFANFSFKIGKFQQKLGVYYWKSVNHNQETVKHSHDSTILDYKSPWDSHGT